MNYYEHHLGDYAKDAGHLSLIEEGAYRRLLDAYYTRERPLPADLRECCKLARATSKPERDAVAYVLAEFFTLDPDGGHRQGRADAEIARFQDKQRKAKASAEARWGKSDGNANADANASAAGMRTHSEGNAPRARPQSPVTSPQGREGEAVASPVDLGEPEGRPQLALVPPSPEATPLADCPHQELVALYRQHLPHLRQPMQWDGKRADAMRTRWQECSEPSAFGDGYRTKAQGLAFWTRFFVYVASVPKLRDGIASIENGQQRVWKPSLDWLVVKGNFLKVIEGAYA